MNRFIQLLSVIALLLCVWGTTAALAEDPPTKKKDSQGDLTEGLMDLLREPAQSQATPAPANQPASPNQSPTIDGEDIGQGPTNPLAEVQLGMSTLAQWMRSRPDVARTKQLQRDVVLRLDELIGQLEQQSPSPSQSAASSSTSSSASESSQASQSQSQSSASAESARGANANQSPKGRRPNNSPSQQSADGKSDQDADSQNSSSRPQQPGQSDGGNNPQLGQPGVSPMSSRNVTVDLNDPRALQRSAWGNLPERTREQMQSRMVERFLPPYRDEIEAYYRALAK